jgi:hypothetical protein
MPNEIEVTAPPITPLDTALEGVGSALVFTVTSPPALAGPNVQPASVTVTAVPAESAVPVTDNTMDVTPGSAVSESCLATTRWQWEWRKSKRSPTGSSA